ncbi:hypothetical protein AAV35_002935 [Salimicrobium jeotgali]|uniref:Uncharacterized protein n=1 Tax=Salimicrobium jeotgali TaxID=1230341 RepID=K2GCX5_9BACI|nr:hypothetical protein [Salimicrobium jeotgali]AKG03840.1 hypothetical protein AAV35_002935 [Salimicrobium jeotgali]EKE32863.1 hypothetical protein MJ3_00145 [Salimicrobium jeotgali]MBM7695144.1 Flp pilus assembly protein TadB [Salimicrobium jeotgali]
MKYVAGVLIIAFLVAGGVFGAFFLTSGNEIKDPEISRIVEDDYNLETNREQSNVKDSYESLLTQAEDRLAELKTEVKEDLEEESSYLDMYEKYEPAAKKLEEKTDEKFQDLHEQLQQAGEEEKASTLKAQYERQKEEWKKSIVKEMKERL